MATQPGDPLPMMQPDANGDTLEVTLRFTSKTYGPIIITAVYNTDDPDRPTWIQHWWACNSNDENDAIYTDTELLNTIDKLLETTLPGHLLARHAEPYHKYTARSI